MATLGRASDYSRFELGRSRDVALVQTSRDNRDAVIAMLSQAQRTVDIFSRDLDRAIYDDGEVLSALRALVVGSSRALVRVLVRDPRPAIARGHRLVYAAQRLSTFIQIRTVAREHRNYNTGLCIVDATGTVVRRFADRYEGEACFSNPVEARDLGRLFDDMWAVASADPNIRSLHI